MAQAPAATARVSWAQLNATSLELEMERLRLRMERRLLWLRACWQAEDAGAALTIGESGFHEDSSASKSLAGRIAELSAVLQEKRACEGPSSLDLLSELFRLNEFERLLVLLCLAAEDQPAFVTLFAAVHGDTQLRHPTFDLALSVFCQGTEDKMAARSVLTPASALRRFRLVTGLETQQGPSRSLRPLALDERIADYLHGWNQIDESVAQIVRPVRPVPLGPSGMSVVERLVRWVESGAAQEAWPLIHFTGPSGAGKLAVARAFCQRAGLQLYLLDTVKLPAPDSPNARLMQSLVQRETLLTKMAIYLDLSEVNTADRAAASAVRDWVENSAGVLFVGSTERWAFRRPVMHLAVSRPDKSEQNQLWAQTLLGADAVLHDSVEAVVEQFDFGPESIVQTAEAARTMARQHAAESISASHLWSACRDHVGWKMQALAQRLEPVYTWDDIVLPDDVMRQIREIADQVAARARVYEEWRFGAKLPRGRGISALFSGPSGTGKTMAAEILANHLRLDLLRIDLAGVVSKYIGETEKNLKNVFDAAEQTGAMLFFDEADALFGKRTEVKDSHDRYANIETNYLLQRMEDYRGLAILCTNRRSALDRAFMRRLRFLVDFPAPDASQRKRIWERVIPAEAPVVDLDLDALSRMEVSGGNIRNIALNAAFLAAGEGSAIGMRHLMHAARREYSKIDKLLTEAEFGRHYGRATG